MVVTNAMRLSPGRIMPASHQSDIGLLLCSLIVMFVLVVSAVFLFAPVPADLEVPKPVHIESSTHVLDSSELGKFGEMMIDLVAKDLPFTVFVPSKVVSQRFIQAWLTRVGGVEAAGFLKNLSSYRESDETEDAGAEKSTNMTSDMPSSILEKSYLFGRLSAVVSRVMSFSTVPRQITSDMVPPDNELEVESLSGYRLYLANDARRGFLVNNFSCSTTNIRRHFLVVHFLEGMLMDSEFERSIILDASEGS